MPESEIIEAPPALEVPRSGAQGAISGEALLTSAEAGDRELAGDIPILMYHSVANEGPPELAAYRVSPQAFQEQMSYLRRHGYHSISVEEWTQALATGTKIPGRPVLITFDDGYRNIHTHAAPLLEEAGFRATVFVVTDVVGGNADWDRSGSSGPPLELMDWNELRDLQRRGFEIASHTNAHVRLVELTDAEIVSNSIAARATLQRELGREVTSVAFPWGHSDPRVRAALTRGGYRVCLGTSGGRSCLDDDPLQLPRIEIRGDDDLATFERRVLGSQDQAIEPTGAAPEGREHGKVTKKGTAVTPEYARVLAARLGTVVEILAGLQEELLSAIAPPESMQRRLTGLFTMPITGEAARNLVPYEPVAPGVHFGFDTTATVSLHVRPKTSHSVSPEACLNVLKLAYSGRSRWLTVEAACSWAELATAERYQIALHAEPQRLIRVEAMLRLPQNDGNHLHHHFATLKLEPNRRAHVSAGQLKLPDLGNADHNGTPLLLLFFDPEQDLQLQLNYINAYFG